MEALTTKKLPCSVQDFVTAVQFGWLAFLKRTVVCHLGAEYRVCIVGRQRCKSNLYQIRLVCHRMLAWSRPRRAMRRRGNR